jgi:hypothetical protein
MKTRSPCFLLLAVLADATPGLAQEPATPRQQITIPQVQTPPRLEDFLTGTPAGVANGTTAGVRIEGFRQRSPGDLTPISERTETFLSYDAEHFYAVFVCYSSDPARVRARMARREAVFSDDVVGILFDTFKDRQRAYMFFANPLGIQGDGITTEGQGDDFSFDTVWHARGRLTSFGYVVWMAVPFKSLRFPASDGPQSWGLSLMRMIPANDEQAFWPGITQKVGTFMGQFADANGLQGVSPGRNIQLIPYGTFTGARFLQDNAFERDADGRAGIDAKVVVRDAMTFDITANPDFSQVESDEPQVTVNQRFEVFFPEKRPFFLENAGYFQTPITLFFSRRVRDPQIGVRSTGKMGAWAVGALAIDDRAQGNSLPADDPLRGDRGFNAVVRARREFGGSNVGALVTNRDFGPSFNRVASADARIKLNPRWYLAGQAVVSGNQTLAGDRSTDSAYTADVSRSGRMFNYSFVYRDIGKDFRVPLGFVPRTDIRQAEQSMSVRWRPKSGPVRSFGPNSYVQATWNRGGELQDWEVRYPFDVQFRGQNFVFARHVQKMERFGGIEFREHENGVNFFSSYLKWLDIGMSVSNGTRPNFFPASGLTAFLADYRDAYLSLGFRPLSGLLIDQTYIYSHLSTRAGSARKATIFDNHILRSRVNYQFNRELSMRAILDYNGVLANPALVSLDRSKHVTFDLLATYLVNPGTAVYIGYTDGYDNLRIDAAGARVPIRNPTTSTGRQVFVKASYLFRF